MDSLEGAWTLYKAVAKAEHCCAGSYLIKTARGKGCVNIMPLQNTLDISPLPYSAKEFEKMPKARCAKCLTDMPVQLLAVYVQKCETDMCIDISDCESEPRDYLLSDSEVPSISTKVEDDHANLGDELDSSSAVIDVKLRVNGRKLL
ncbi:unnamed protein product [Leuciscus chuanchicus]